MNGEVFSDNFVEHLSRFVGETVIQSSPQAAASPVQALPELFCLLIRVLSA